MNAKWEEALRDTEHFSPQHSQLQAQLETKDGLQGNGAQGRDARSDALVIENIVVFGAPYSKQTNHKTH